MLCVTPCKCHQGVVVCLGELMPLFALTCVDISIQDDSENLRLTQGYEAQGAYKNAIHDWTGNVQERSSRPNVSYFLKQ